MEELKVTDKPSEIGFYSGLVVSDSSRLVLDSNPRCRTLPSLLLNAAPFFNGVGCKLSTNSPNYL